MKLLKRLAMILISAGTICAVFAEGCLDKFKPYFDSRQANLTYSSKFPNAYFVQDSKGSTTGQCKTTYKALHDYLVKNYTHAAKGHPNIVIGWNYWAVNNQVIYDYLATITPAMLKENFADPSQGGSGEGSISNQAEYKPRTLVNNQYACYYSQQFYYVTGTPHPTYATQLACSQSSKPEKLLTLAELADEKSVVQKLVQTPYLQQALAKAKINTRGLASYAALQDKLNNSGNDELVCIADSLNEADTSFIIARLNNDKTVNLVLGLNSSAPPCSQVYHEVELTMLKPKFAIKEVIAASLF